MSSVILGDEFFAKKFKNSIILSQNKNLSEPVASHPDMNLFVCDKTAFLPKNSPLESVLKEKGYNVILIKNELKSEYPFDVLFNAKIVDDTAILNEKTIAKEILEYLKESNKTIINVNQGYAACSVLALNKNAFITSDKGVAKVLKETGKDVLKICEGYINIKDYSYGFIGGASGFIDGILYFFGDITCHPDFKLIDEFLRKNNVKYKYFNTPLKDIGGCIEI